MWLSQDKGIVKIPSTVSSRGGFTNYRCIPTAQCYSFSKEIFKILLKKIAFVNKMLMSLTLPGNNPQPQGWGWQSVCCGMGPELSWCLLRLLHAHTSAHCRNTARCLLPDASDIHRWPPHLHLNIRTALKKHNSSIKSIKYRVWMSLFYVMWRYLKHLPLISHSLLSWVFCKVLNPLNFCLWLSEYPERTRSQKNEQDLPTSPCLVSLCKNHKLSTSLQHLRVWWLNLITQKYNLMINLAE